MYERVKKKNDGAGWIAARSPGGGDDKKREKWFNIKTCGSWRMAFLMARLQRQHWDSRATWLAAPAGSDAVRTPVKRAKAKSPAPQEDGEKVAKRTKIAGTAAQSKVITSEVLAGSSRVKQILEAGRRLQLWQQQVVNPALHDLHIRVKFVMWGQHCGEMDLGHSLVRRIMGCAVCSLGWCCFSMSERYVLNR